MAHSSSHARGLALGLLGILVLSPDTLLVRLLDLEPWTMLFYRGLGITVALLSFLALTNRRAFAAKLLGIGGTGIAASICFCLGNILFILALGHTSVANVLAIIGSSPIFGALLSWLILGEKLPLRTWVAAFLAVIAVGIITSADLNGGGNLLGDALALIHTIIMATGFVLVRRKVERDMVPCMAVSGTLTAILSLFLATHLAVSATSLPLLALLCLLVLPLSFGLLVTAPRHIPAPEVNMIMLLEMILGPLFVWAIVGEAVPPATFVGGGLLFMVLLGHSYLGLRAVRGCP